MNQLQKEVQEGKAHIGAEKKLLEEERQEFEQMKLRLGSSPQSDALSFDDATDDGDPRGGRPQSL